MEQYLRVGVISSTHGVRGEVKVYPTTDDPARFKKLKKVILDTVSYTHLVQRAIDFGAEIFYDERAASPYFNYWQDSVWHQVWFEDVRSYRAKFDLIREFGLKGGGFWSVMQLFRAGLLLMDGTFDIRHGQNNQTMI